MYSVHFIHKTAKEFREAGFEVLIIFSYTEEFLKVRVRVQRHS